MSGVSHSNQPKLQEYDDAEAAIKQFQADSQRVLTELADAEKAIVDAEAQLKSVLEDQRQRMIDGQATVAGERADVKEKRDAAESKEESLRKSVAAKELELRGLRNGQSPLIGFVGAYEALVEAFVEYDALLLLLEDKRAVVQDARAVLNQVENDILDLEIAAETADSANDRASAKLALNEADARLQKRRSERADAEDNLADCQRGLSRAEADVETLQQEAAELRAKLDPSDLATMRVLDSLKAYESALVEKGKAIAFLKSKQKELDSYAQSTDNPYVDYADAKKAYLEAKRQRLAADREVSILEKHYLDNGGGAAAKQYIRRAKAVADEAKSREKVARETMVAAKSLVDDEDKAVKILTKEIKAARDEVASQSLVVADEQKMLEDAFAKARVAAGPDEEKRIERVKEVAEELQKLKDDHEASLNALSDLQRQLQKHDAAINAATAVIRDLDDVITYVKEAEISGLISKLVKEVESIRLSKTLGFVDGDNLVALCDDVRLAAEENALSSIATTAIRGDHSELITKWTRAVRVADECALRLASAGAALSRDLLD